MNRKKLVKKTKDEPTRKTYNSDGSKKHYIAWTWFKFILTMIMIAVVMALLLLIKKYLQDL